MIRSARCVVIAEEITRLQVAKPKRTRKKVPAVDGVDLTPVVSQTSVPALPSPESESSRETPAGNVDAVATPGAGIGEDHSAVAEGNEDSSLSNDKITILFALFQMLHEADESNAKFFAYFGDRPQRGAF